MILVKAGSPVDATIDSLMPLLEEGDIIIDGGNEWCALFCACYQSLDWPLESPAFPSTGWGACSTLVPLPEMLALHRYENTEARAKKVAEKGLMYMGMGVSGGEEGARNGAHTAVLLAKHALCPAGKQPLPFFL